MGLFPPAHWPNGGREAGAASRYGPKDESFMLSKFFAILGYYINAEHNHYEL